MLLDYDPEYVDYLFSRIVHDMSEKYIVRFEILSQTKAGELELADQVSVQLLSSNVDLPLSERVSKETVKPTLFDALDIGFIWLERALKN